MRGLISVLVIAVTVIVQLTIVDRIAFPGGACPNLVLLAVAALALAGGPLAGALTGFWAGLALDVAPPGSHFVGQDALVFCLIGYACGLLADDASGDNAEQGHTALFEIVVMAAAAVCGEALAALLGVMLSDPRVTWPAIRNVLPAAVAYDVLLCPFVLYAVAAALRLAGARGEGRRAGWSASQARTPAPGANQGAIRQLAGGNSLRLSDRDKGPGAAGGLRGPGARPVARREPRLKLGRAGPKTSTTAYRDGHGAGASRVRFGGKRREGVLGGSLLGSASPAGFALRSSALRSSALRSSALRNSALRNSALRGSGRRGSGLGGSRFGSSSMGRSLLGGSVFSRSSSSSSLGHSSAFGRSSSRFGRSAVFGRGPPWPVVAPAAPGQPDAFRGRRAGRACSPVFPRWLARPAHRPPALVGCTEVTRPGLAARRVLARPFTRPQPTGPQPTGPQPTGPQPTGPQPTGPQLTGPERVRPPGHGPGFPRLVQRGPPPAEGVTHRGIRGFWGAPAAHAPSETAGRRLHQVVPCSQVRDNRALGASLQYRCKKIPS